MTAKQLRASRKIPPDNEQLVASAAAALEQLGTLDGAAAALHVHWRTVKHATDTNETLRDAYVKGKTDRLARLAGAAKAKSDERYATLKAELDAIQAKMDEATAHLQKDYLSLYANDITRILLELKELSAERSKIKATMSASYYHDGTPRK